MEKLFSIIYMVICIGLPILYFILYKKNVRRPNYLKALAVSLTIFALLFGIKLIVHLGEFNKLDCYLNNYCDNYTSETSTTTTSTTTTTTKVFNPNLVGQTSKGYDIELIDGGYYINGLLIANKTYALSKNFIPKNTHVDASKYDGSMCRECIDNTVYDAWLVMQQAALDDNIKLSIWSGYRSYNVQAGLYNSYVNRDGKDKADTYSARPGNSEHQTGLGFDINMASSSFNNTKEAKWLNDNAYKYGFILRYPDGKSDETGYKFESWHYRYVGEDLAKILYNNGNWITLENYLGITSIYPN